VTTAPGVTRRTSKSFSPRPAASSRTSARAASAPARPGRPGGTTVPRNGISGGTGFGPAMYPWVIADPSASCAPYAAEIAALPTARNAISRNRAIGANRFPRRTVGPSRRSAERTPW
jgi:hypothetical protein